MGFHYIVTGRAGIVGQDACLRCMVIALETSAECGLNGSIADRLVFQGSSRTGCC